LNDGWKRIIQNGSGVENKYLNHLSGGCNRIINIKGNGFEKKLCSPKKSSS
jgi:hypothetical protein